METDSFSLPPVKMREEPTSFCFLGSDAVLLPLHPQALSLPAAIEQQAHQMFNDLSTRLCRVLRKREPLLSERLWSASPSQLECRVHNRVFHRKVADERIRLHVHAIETAKFVSMEAVALALHLLALQRAQHHDRHLVVRSVAQTSSGRKRFAEHPSAPAPRRHPWRLLSNCTCARGMDKHRSQPPRKRYVRLFALASEHLRAKCWLDGSPCRLIESTVFHRVNHQRKNS